MHGSGGHGYCMQNSRLGRELRPRICREAWVAGFARLRGEKAHGSKPDRVYVVGSRSMRMVSRFVPNSRTTSALVKLPGCCRASQRWRSRGSSSGRSIAVPWRQRARRPSRTFTRTRVPDDVANVARLPAMLRYDPELRAHASVSDRVAPWFSGTAANSLEQRIAGRNDPKREEQLDGRI